MANKNEDLRKANKAKKDEFYTQLLDIKKLNATCYSTSPVAYTQLSLFDVEGIKITKKSSKYLSKKLTFCFKSHKVYIKSTKFKINVL